jgi:hypothetical protein
MEFLTVNRARARARFQGAVCPNHAMKRKRLNRDSEPLGEKRLFEHEDEYDYLNQRTPKD